MSPKSESLLGSFPELGKTKIRTLLDLALCVPCEYRDTRPCQSLREGRNATVGVTPISVEKRSKRLLVSARTHLGVPLDIVVFHPKPYHFSLFKGSVNLYVYGKVERFGARLQMANPKQVTPGDRIEPRYKTALRSDRFWRIVQALLTQEALENAGLPSETAEVLRSTHFPNDALLRRFESGLGFDEAMVRALKFTEIFAYLGKLATKRRRFEAIKPLIGSAVPLIERLPFSLTEDQQTVIAQIGADLRRSVAARRMVVGDVGSGKTMVILAAAMMAYPERALLMAPTSVLARQLYDEATRWLPENVKVALVTQNTCFGEPSEAHLVVGTQALLHRELPQALLVMVDEQHRFGAKQRQALETRVQQGKKRPHYLQFSATPIPRTQAMVDASLIDVSLIASVPFKKDITTKMVGKSDFPGLLEHLRLEINAGRQALVVYPLVEESDKLAYRSLESAADFWQSRFKNVYITHGKDPNKETVLREFAQKGMLLLATTVIEVGISLPKLSTIVISGAERMGLSTLHQLRGRVSRNGLKGYCFLFTREKKNPRLEAFAKTLNGFEIARLDLKFRQSGDMLEGWQQSGQQFVWLDMAEDEAVIAAAKARLEQLQSALN